MNPIYQVFAEAPDGSIYLVVGRHRNDRWFYDIEEAREVARQATAFGNADIWIVEGKGIEKVPVPETKDNPKEMAATSTSSIHLYHDFDASRDIPGDHDLNGDQCHDQVGGMIHRQADLDRLADVLHEMGFRMKASRVSRKILIDDPDFLPKRES